MPKLHGQPDGTPVTLGGKSYTLRYERDAMYQLDMEMGITMLDLFDALPKMSMKVIVGILWAGLVHDQPRLRPHDVAKLVGPQEIKDLMPALQEAIRQMTGFDPDAKDEGNAD